MQPEQHLKKLQAEAVYDTRLPLVVPGIGNTGSSTTPIGPDSHWCSRFLQCCQDRGLALSSLKKGYVRFESLTHDANRKIEMYW